MRLHETDRHRTVSPLRAPARRCALPIAVALLAAPLAAWAQAFPSKTIRIIAPYAAGGGADTIARALAPKLSEALGQPVIVENRTGANGTIGSDFVAKSAPDGHTLVSTIGPSHHTIQFFQKNVPYDPVKDFTAISIAGTVPQTLVVGPGLSQVNTLRDLINHARRNPGKLSFGSSGAGTSQHLGGILLNSAAGIDMLHVPYKGGAAALIDVLGGQIPVAILVLSNVNQHIKAGKLRALGVLEAKRSRAAPDIPTIAEAGVPGYALPDTWAGVLGPKDIAPPVVARLNAEIVRALQAPEVRSRLEGLGFDVTGSSAQEFAQLLATSVDTYRQIVTRAGITPE